ncbi:MAG TPA: hypothetical protein VLT45_06340 [Kofleriaceae bacterium]|nr:hypothetical protein [Kofleriaceae bacterium]
MRKILLAMLAVTACSSSKNSGSGPDGGVVGSGGDGGGGTVSDADKQQDYNDVAASIAANLSVGELPSMVDAVNMAYGRVPQGYAVTQKTDSAGTMYELLDGTRGGVTIEYKLYCRDSADATVACNGTENHAHVKPVYTGSVTAASASIDSIQRSAAWIVRDLGLPSARLGGDGTDNYVSHLSTGDYQIMATDTLKNALFDPAAPTTPTAGTLDVTVNVQRTRSTSSPAARSFAVSAHLVFTGSDAATLTLDGTQNYAVTISSGAVTKQ